MRKGLDWRLNLGFDAKRIGKRIKETAKKARNKAISGFRVLVEHAIGGLKRFGIATEKCRNKNDKFNDQVMTISCGLWNYHLKRC